MNVFRGFHHALMAPACALTIGNFDGVHRGHQALLSLLRSEAEQRGVPSCVMTFEPHPRDFFARRAGNADLAPARIATLRDKLTELARCGVDQCLVVPFNAHFSALSADAFIRSVLWAGLKTRYLLVGDDFRFGRNRLGNFDMLASAGAQYGFDVARMNSYEISNIRASSSAVREALSRGALMEVARLLGRTYAISGRVVHGRQLGRELNCRTLNVRFGHDKPAVMGVFVARVWGLSDSALPAVASLGVRPTLNRNDANGGQVLLETHCLDWPAPLGCDDGYGKIIRVELLHKLHDERKYDGLDALQHAISLDRDVARQWFDQNPSHAHTP